MDPRLILVVGVLFAFVKNLKSKSQYAKIIGWVSIVAVVMILFPIYFVAVDGHYLLILTLISAVIYAFGFPNFSTIKKVIISGSAIITSIPITLFLFEHPLFTIAAVITGIIQLTIFIFSWIKYKSEIENEFGFLGIHAAFSIIHLIGGIYILMNQ